MEISVLNNNFIVVGNSGTIKVLSGSSIIIIKEL